MEYNFNTIGPQMLSVAIVMIGIMVFFAIIEFNLSPMRDLRIQKEVQIEAFDNNDGFCKTHEGDRNKLQNSCSELTRNNCLATSCCVYAKMEGVEQCHSGDINGPTFKRDAEGKSKQIDYYYFRNKCIGNGCKV